MTERGGGNDKGGDGQLRFPSLSGKSAVARPLANRTVPQRGDDGSFNFNCILNNRC